MKLKNRQKNKKLAMIFLSVIVVSVITIIILINYKPSPYYVPKQGETIFDFNKLPLPLIINENDIFE